MGIRIHRNTWRAPLQLIDSWLPPEHKPAATPTRLGAAAQRFVRAGWLSRRFGAPAGLAPVVAAPANAPASTAVTGATARTHPPPPLRVTVRHGAVGRSDSRVVLSGRLADVCAELERLAALEPVMGRAHG